MVEDFREFEPGDLLIACRAVFVVDPDISPLDTLWEGNSMVYPKGTIALVVETITLKDERRTPVLNVLINEQLATVLYFGFELIRKGIALSS